QQIAEAIINRAPAGIARLDANLVITSMNSQFAQQFGDWRLTGGSQQLLGRFIFQVLSESPTEKLIDAVEKKIPFYISDFSMRSIAGQRYWDLAGWPVEGEDGGMILLVTEVTDRVNLAQQREDFVATLTHDLKNPLISAIRILSVFINEESGLDEN